MENNGKNAEEELMIKFSMFEQQIRQIQQQLEVLERNILEMNSLNVGLDEFKKAEGKEILAQIGKNIFVKTKLVSDELIVDIGSGNFVKKDIESTKKLIAGQVKKLENIKNELNSALQNIDREMTGLMVEAQGKRD